MKRRLRLRLRLLSTLTAVFFLLGTMSGTVVVSAKPNLSTPYVAYDAMFSMSDQTIHRAISEHFQVIWGNSGSITDASVQGTLTNLESVRKYFVEVLQFQDSGISLNNEYSGNRWKTNLYIANSGLTNMGDGKGWTSYMGADSHGLGYMVMCPEALRVDPPTWVIAHEYGHVLTYALKGWNEQEITGPWWETVAQWFMAKYLTSDYYSFNGKNYSPDAEGVLNFYTHLSGYQPNSQDYYQYWPLLMYIEENPDHLPGLGHGMVMKMISQAKPNEYPFDILARLAAPTSIKDILGNFSKRLATQQWFNPQNYSAEKYRSILAANRRNFTQDILNATDPSIQSQVFTTLKASSAEGWWEIPADQAPMQSGINLIPITAKQYSLNMSGNKTLSVEFQALSSSRNDGDFRVSLVKLSKSRQATYSKLWSTGVGSITLDQDTASIDLVVATTPNTIIPTSAFKEVFNANIRFPYMVRMTTK